MLVIALTHGCNLRSLSGRFLRCIFRSMRLLDDSLDLRLIDGQPTFNLCPFFLSSLVRRIGCVLDRFNSDPNGSFVGLRQLLNHEFESVKTFPSGEHSCCLRKRFAVPLRAYFRQDVLYLVTISVRDVCLVQASWVSCCSFRVLVSHWTNPVMTPGTPRSSIAEPVSFTTPRGTPPMVLDTNLLQSSTLLSSWTEAVCYCSSPTSQSRVLRTAPSLSRWTKFQAASFSSYAHPEHPQWSCQQSHSTWSQVGLNAWQHLLKHSNDLIKLPGVRCIRRLGVLDEAWLDLILNVQLLAFFAERFDQRCDAEKLRVLSSLKTCVFLLICKPLANWHHPRILYAFALLPITDLRTPVVISSLTTLQCFAIRVHLVASSEIESLTNGSTSLVASCFSRAPTSTVFDIRSRRWSRTSGCAFTTTPCCDVFMSLLLGCAFLCCNTCNSRLRDSHLLFCGLLNHCFLWQYLLIWDTLRNNILWLWILCDSLVRNRFLDMLLGHLHHSEIDGVSFGILWRALELRLLILLHAAQGLVNRSRQQT